MHPMSEPWLDWKTIESARKDIRIFILDHGEVYLARWSENAKFGGNEYEGPGWQIFECDGDEWYAVATNTATHWALIPDNLPEV